MDNFSINSESTKPGSPKPLGATITDQGVNFSLFSKHATQVTLCLLEVKSKKILIEIPLNPTKNRTGNIWHLFIEKLQLPLLYAYRVTGPHKPLNFFDPQTLLCDPYAKVYATSNKWGADKNYHPYALLMPDHPFDWNNTSSPNHKLKDLVIYEMHVRGFTQHSSSKVSKPGTYLGIIEKIPYLLDLGINAVELMPIHEFNETEYIKSHPQTNETLYNYWGYSTVNFFVPMNRYAFSDQMGSSISEFKTMVKELHRNGIEVILDVVFNHTSEKVLINKAYSFLGIDRACYYLLMKNGHDYNFTGCDNTMNLNHPVMRQFVRDCLHYWVTEMHVDGFRFDLATVMNRDMKGNVLSMAPLIEELTHDPLLANTKLIAEPWDCAAYQVGDFYTHERRWAEWNDKYRDHIRKFIRGDSYSKNDFAKRISGSEDLFPQRSPEASINFIIAHDGFTLKDLVSYNKKHNLVNGENNNDGNSDNMSWNCGDEGGTDNPNIIELRYRQMKNLLLSLMISRGVPMFLMGDEYGHSKHGNNNTWCHDNELNWFLWDQLKDNPFYPFIRQMIHFRHTHPILRKDEFFTINDIKWHGTVPNQPEWEKKDPVIAFTIIDHETTEDLYVAFNATAATLNFTLPQPRLGKHWYQIIDTFSSSPDDIFLPGKEKKMESLNKTIHGHSSILLKMM